MRYAAAQPATRYGQLRLDAYNAPNHVEWNTWNSTAQFNAAGQITNLPPATNRFGFGALNTVRTNSQGILQIAVKLYF
jgi:hypothetical protein